jgi:hypothetical protein
MSSSSSVEMPRAREQTLDAETFDAVIAESAIVRRSLTGQLVLQNIPDMTRACVRNASLLALPACASSMLACTRG